MLARIVNPELKKYDKARATYDRTYRRLAAQAERAESAEQYEAVMVALTAANDRLAAAKAAADATAKYVEVSA